MRPVLMFWIWMAHVNMFIQRKIHTWPRYQIMNNHHKPSVANLEDVPAPLPSPLILGKKEETIEGRKAGRASKTKPPPTPIPLSQGLDPTLTQSMVFQAWRPSAERKREHDPGHMWVEFVVGSRSCSERFFSGFSGFPPSTKTNTPNSNSNRKWRSQVCQPCC